MEDRDSSKLSRTRLVDDKDYDQLSLSRLRTIDDTDNDYYKNYFWPLYSFICDCEPTGTTDCIPCNRLYNKCLCDSDDPRLCCVHKPLTLDKRLRLKFYESGYDYCYCTPSMGLSCWLHKVTCTCGIPRASKTCGACNAAFVIQERMAAFNKDLDD